MLTPPRTPRYLRRQPLLDAAAFAVAVALAGAAGAAEYDAARPALLRAAVQSDAAAVEPADGDLRSRFDNTAGLSIGAEKLHDTLLRQFYSSFNFQPVWPSRPRQADALLAAVWNAGEHGLDPDLFHGALLRNLGALPPVERDLVLSDAFLAYADALARGAVPVERRLDDEDLKPEAVDIPATLVTAIDSPDPTGVIAGLAPRSSEYAALRRALQARRQSPGGKNGENELRQIVVNLERWRWLPRNLPADRVWVNAASAQLVLYRANQPTFTTRVVVGQTTWQTPELETAIEGVLYNPPWNVPPSIATQEILPKLAADPDYLARHHMVRRSNGSIQQLPGNGTALGYLKFEMPNRFDVYLHDTPMRQLFARDNRRQSHGCIRVQNPRELAALLIQQSVEAVNQGIAGGATSRRTLPTPMPVFVVYQTATAGPDGRIEFRPDVYNRDAEIWQRLHPARQAPIAEREFSGQRRS